VAVGSVSGTRSRHTKKPAARVAKLTRHSVVRCSSRERVGLTLMPRSIPANNKPVPGALSSCGRTSLRALRAMAIQETRPPAALVP